MYARRIHSIRVAIPYSDVAPKSPTWLILIFIHLKLCLADATHNFKRVEIILMLQSGSQRFLKLADWRQVLSSACPEAGIYCADNN